MNRPRQLATLLALAFCLAAGCGPKQELMAGADKMTDEQKLKAVHDYCDQWIFDTDASLKAKGLAVFPAAFSGVKPDGQCDIQIDRLSNFVRTSISKAQHLVLLNVGPGEFKVNIQYLNYGGNHINDKCVATVLCLIGTEIYYFHKYYPDPRVFAVLLPSAK